MKRIVALSIYWLINVIFIIKYLPRAGVPAVVGIVVYSVLLALVYVACKKYVHILSERTCNVLSLTAVAIVSAAAVFLLWYIEPLSINVDRWSALAYFDDALLNGIYPYGVHTHVSDVNYPSPFPFWQYVYLPFYLLGDVGLGQILFLWLTVYCVYGLCRSWRITLIFIVLLFFAPAYWWELAVRSDGLSNTLLVLCVILSMKRYGITLKEHFWLVALLCGLIASTRMSAVVPMAIYLFNEYVRLPWRRMILFPIVIALIFIGFLLPYIFWDTESWLFFNRNPLMSQTGESSVLMLLVLVLVGIYVSLRKTDFDYLLFVCGAFMFIFMLVQLSSRVWIEYLAVGQWFNVLEWARFDISYFSLSLPYLIAYLSRDE